MFVQDWIYFEKVVECGNIGHAAEALYRTYQGVYTSIARLEKEIGNPLFIRELNNVKLTEFGKYVHSELAAPLISYWDSLKTCSGLYENYTSNKLRIGILAGSSPWIEKSKNVLELFTAQNPQADIICESSDYRNNLAGIENDYYDIAMTMPQLANGQMCQVLSFPRVYSLFVGKNHPLVAKDSVTIADIKRCSLLFFSKGDIGECYLTNNGVDIQHSIYLSIDNPDANRLLKENIAVRFAPDDSEARSIQQRLFDGCVKVSFDPPIAVNVSFVYKTRPVQKQLLNRLLVFLKERFPEYQ